MFSKKWIGGLLLVGLILLQYRLWMGSQGLRDMIMLKRELKLQVETNEQLKKRNELLMQQVKALKNNHEAVESHARHDLGMIKKGETFYQVVQ